MFRFVASLRGSEAIARSEYFTSGAQVLNIIEQLVRWKFGSFEGLSTFLDFASGYGRLTRFLVQKIPADRIWVSDIQADAVAFQETEFGVHGFVSTVDPEALPCDQTFDCIFVASLFSHLPPTTFTLWLKKLYNLLKPEGLLVFSVIAENRMPAEFSMPESGICFVEVSEIASLDTKAYGLTFVTEAFVRDAIAAATGRSAYLRLRYGMQFHQDLYLVVNDETPDFSGLRYTNLPHGTVELGLWTEPGELYLKGWAAGMTEADWPVEVRVFIDGQLRERCLPSMPRPDLHERFGGDGFPFGGWQCTCHIPDGDLTRLATVTVKSPDGTESLLYLGDVASLLPTGIVESCRWTGPGELYVKGWVAGTAEAGPPVEVQIFVGGQLRQKCLPFVRRPDLQEYFKDDTFLYSGWECTCHLQDDDPTQLLEVKSISPTGAESRLYLGTIASLVPPAPDAQVAESAEQGREALLQLGAELERRLEYVRHLEAEIARKNEALVYLERHVNRPRPQRAWARWPRWPWRRRSPGR
ncbi:MAG: class I SAM-dependent methyltransferase [Chloroflexia bacterium]